MLLPLSIYRSARNAKFEFGATQGKKAGGPPPNRANTAGAAFAVTLSVPRLNRSSRMSTSSLLLARLAWLSFICTSLADADVVAVTTAGTTSKCLDTCGTARDGICQEMRNGSDPGGWWMVDGRSGDWCELGTDCADCAACCNGTSITRSWCDCAPPPNPPRYSHIGAVGLPTPPLPAPPPLPPPAAGTMLVPATRYTVSFYVSETIGPFDWRHWSGMEAGLRSYLQCFEPDCTAMLQGYTDTSTMYSYNILVEAVVTDAAGNGSSTATVGRAAALSQESEAGLFKALAVTVEGPVTASAPHMVMVQVSPLTRPPSTAPPPEPEALPDDPPMLADCDDPPLLGNGGGFRRPVFCEEDVDRNLPRRRSATITVVVAIAFIAMLFAFPMAVALRSYGRVLCRVLLSCAEAGFHGTGGFIVGIILWLNLRVLSPSWLLNYKWFGLDATVIVGIIAFSVPFFVTCACQLCAAAEEAYDRKQEQLSDTRLRV